MLAHAQIQKRRIRHPAKVVTIFFVLSTDLKGQHTEKKKAIKVKWIQYNAQKQTCC